MDPFTGILRPRRQWIQLSNLEAQLVNGESRTQAVRLLEKLLDHAEGEPLLGLIVTSSIDPVAQFKEIFEQERNEIYTDPIPEVQLSRASMVLSRFRRCYQPLSGRESWETPGVQLWRRWIHYKPQEWIKTAEVEVEACEPIREIYYDLQAKWQNHPSISRHRLALAFQNQARAYYELLWASCSRSEKLALIQLAQEGLINPSSSDVVSQLAAKGLITSHQPPAICNYSFRAFLCEIERRDVIHEWEAMEGSGLWVVVGRLAASTLVAGGLFFVLTQDFSSFQALLPLVTGSGFFGVPFVRDAIAKLTSKSAAGTSVVA
jgi:hypothetical protein